MDNHPADSDAVTAFKRARDNWRATWEGKRALAGVSEQPSVIDEIKHVLSDLSEKHHAEIPEIQMVLSDLSEKVHDRLISGDDALRLVEAINEGLSKSDDRPLVIGARLIIDGDGRVIGQQHLFAKRTAETRHLHVIGSKRVGDVVHFIFGEAP